VNANGLAEREVATLRYQFPYMEQGSKRPDAPKLAQATALMYPACLIASSTRKFVDDALFRVSRSLANHQGNKGSIDRHQYARSSPSGALRRLALETFPLTPPPIIPQKETAPGGSS
jgi:uncharacterized protein